MRRTIKRLSAVLTCVAGVPLVMIAGAAGDPVIRALTSIAGICLFASGSIHFWTLRRHRKRAWEDESPY